MNMNFWRILGLRIGKFADRRVSSQQANAIAIMFVVFWIIRVIAWNEIDCFPGLSIENLDYRTTFIQNMMVINKEAFLTVVRVGPSNFFHY